jgi:alpha-tubulin suppressor-like RCC1 family protein
VCVTKWPAAWSHQRPRDARPAVALRCAADGELFTWGSNDCGMLGHKASEAALEPMRVDSLEAFSIAGVACGQTHMLAVAADGALVTWGSPEGGQLGSCRRRPSVSHPTHHWRDG